MSMLAHHRTLLRGISLFTAMTFLPNSVQAWYFLPEVQQIVLAAEDGPAPLSPAQFAELEARARESPVLLDAAKRAQLAGNKTLPAEVAAAAATPAPSTEPERTVVGTATLDKLDDKSLSRIVSRPTTGPAEADDAPGQLAKAGASEPLNAANDENLPPVPRRRTAWSPGGKSIATQANYSFGAEVAVLELVTATPPYGANPTVPVESPAGLADELAGAEALWAEGKGRETVAALASLAEAHPDDRLELFEAMKALMAEVARGADSEEIAAIEASIPTLWSGLSTAIAKDQICRYYRGRIEALGGPEADNARSYLRLLEQAYWSIVLENPEELYGYFSVRQYMRTRDHLQELEEGRETLRTWLASATASAAAWGGWLYLAEEAEYAQDGSEARACYGKILELADESALDAILQDPSVRTTTKSARLYNLACALEHVGRLQEALAQYQYVVNNFTDPEERLGQTEHVPALLSGLRAARLFARMNESDPYQGILAYHGYIQSHPSAALAGKAMLEMAGLYLRAGDYQQAAAYFGQVMQDYPASDAARIAEQELDFVLANLYDAMEVATWVGAPETVTLVAQNCGTHALMRLLAARGIVATIEELGELAGTNATGTSMLGLLKAAGIKGVELAGVVASNADDLPVPFIAFVRNDHFLLVTDVGAGEVTIADLDKPESAVPRSEFDAMWHGEALVVAGTSETPGPSIDIARLQATRGGTGDPPAQERELAFGYLLPLGYSPAPFDTLQPSVAERQLGSWGRALNSETLVSPVPQNPNPGNFRGNLCSSGVYVPEGYLAVNPVRTGVELRSRDMALPVRGTLQLVYSRTYSCLGGFANPETTDGTAPWSNNTGAGWSHNFNVHLRMPDAGGSGYPASVDYYDERGMLFEFEYDSSSGGEDLFYMVSESPAQGKRLVLARNQGTGAYTLWFDNDSRQTFSAPVSVGANDNFARMESVLDRHGNALTLAYDGSVGTGKLTTVSAPAGDPRQLELAYSGNLVTKVTLTSGATELQSHTYAYDTNSNLTKVTDDASHDLGYTYGSYGPATGSRYMVGLTDKKGASTTLAWTFSLNYYSVYEAYKLVLTNADSLTTTYERSLTTYLTTITNKITTATKSKAVYTPRLTSFLPQSVDYYLNNLTQYERWNYQYGTDGYSLTKVTGPGNAVLAQYSYDADNRFSSATGRTNTTQRYEYASSADWAPTKIYRQDGTTATLEYDANGDVTHASGTETAAGTTYEYDAYGQVTRATDATGNETTYAFDLLGNVTSSTNPLGLTSTQEYDLSGNRTKYIDPHSNETTFEYGSGTCGTCGGGTVGALTKRTDPHGNVTEMEYDAHGNLTRRILPTLVEYTYAYDAMNRVTSSTSPRYGSSATTYTYDVLGRPSTTTLPVTGGRTETRDHMGRVTSSSDATGAVSYTYDSHGNRLTLTDAFNRSTARVYSATHRLTKESDSIGDVTFAYDGKGNNTAITENGTQSTTYGYDDAGRRTLVTDALGKMIHYFYDDEGRLTKKGAGATGTVDTTEHFYDADGVETKITYTSGGGGYDTLKYYDGNGIMTKQTDWIDGTNGVQYGYDSDGRLTRITDYDGSHLDYSYDSTGRVTSMNDYHGNTVSYTYGSAGMVSTITAPGSKVWTYGYDDVNVHTSLALPNGMTAAYLYDGDGRRTAIQYKDGSTVLRGFTVEYAGPDLITKQTHQDGSLWLYYHDGRDRLTKAERYGTDGTTLLHRFTYTLDDNGNALTKAVYEPGVGTETETFAYDAANQLTSQTSGGTTTVFAYDAWGQMTSKTDGTYTAAYAYRYDGKLHAVTTDFPGEAGVTYEYGGDGKRRSRVSGAEETWYNWDREWNVVSEEDDADGSSGTLSRTYIAGAQTIEQVESILADVGGTDPATGDYRHYALDHLGSVRGLYDGTKSAVAAAEYEPYGGVYAESGVAMPYAFTGKPYDGASGLHYFPYRYYASEQLRWMTRDPAEMVDGPNVYLYVTVSPANGFDLMGLKVDWPSTSTIDDCMEDKDFPCADEVMEALGLGDSSGHAIPQGFVYSERPGSLRQVSFRRCCCGHDNCSQRFACDFNWYRCMVGECSDELTRGSRLWRRCRNMALFYFTVVRLFNMSQGVF